MAKKKSKDACYHKVKAGTRCGPAHTLRGTLKCRKVGAATGKLQKAAEGGVVSAIDNPKRPPRRNLKDGGFIAAGYRPAMQEKKRQVTRIF